MSAKRVDQDKEELAGSKRSYLKQSDVPSCSLNEALKVAYAIRDHYGSKPSIPLKVAKALNLEPGASPFKMLCGASIAYGLTDGGYNAALITILELGMRIARPKKEGDDLLAKREAFLRPRVISEFLTQYEGSPVPREDIARNVLEDMGVPKDKLDTVLTLIVEGARELGLTEEIKGKTYISTNAVEAVETEENESEDESSEPLPSQSAKTEEVVEELPEKTQPEIPTVNRRVFITHGKNTAFLEPLKKLLGFGELEAVISVERASVSQPVPDKVMSDMRICGAAIIHVDDEQKLMDSTANEVVVLNPNVLIEIGAAMALYGRRFILVVKEGITLPSNLQGLYEVRYSGDTLDGNATIRLMEAINDIKNHPLPTRGAIDAAR